MQIGRFDAHFPKTGPNYFEECAEEIERTRVGRCNRLHERGPGEPRTGADSTPLAEYASGRYHDTERQAGNGGYLLDATNG